MKIILLILCILLSGCTETERKQDPNLVYDVLEALHQTANRITFNNQFNIED